MPHRSLVSHLNTSPAMLRKQGQLGTIEPGKLAGVIVVDGNPLEDITILQDKGKITLVMKEGSIQVNRMDHS